MPKSVKEAYKIDNQNSNSLWRDTIIEEMKKVRVAFEETSKSSDEPFGYQEITTYMFLTSKWVSIFDVKPALSPTVTRLKHPVPSHTVLLCRATLYGFASLPLPSMDSTSNQAISKMPILQRSTVKRSGRAPGQNLGPPRGKYIL